MSVVRIPEHAVWSAAITSGALQQSLQPTASTLFLRWMDASEWSSFETLWSISYFVLFDHVLLDLIIFSIACKKVMRFYKIMGFPIMV